MTLDDLDVLSVPIILEFRGTSQIWKPTMAKRIVIENVVRH